MHLSSDQMDDINNDNHQSPDITHANSKSYHVWVLRFTQYEYNFTPASPSCLRYIERQVTGRVRFQFSCQQFLAKWEAICYLAAPQPTVGNCQGKQPHSLNVNHCLLLSIFGLKVKPTTCQLFCNALTHRATLSKQICNQ